MKLSNIKAVLTGGLSFKDFRMGILNEMKEYTSSSKEMGKSMPVYVDEDIELSIEENDLRALCEAFLRGVMEESEINYVADALLLSNRVTFENESIFVRLGYLTDPDVNGHLTKEIVEEIINYINRDEKHNSHIDSNHL